MPHTVPLSWQWMSRGEGVGGYSERDSAPLICERSTPRGAPTAERSRRQTSGVCRCRHCTTMSACRPAQGLRDDPRPGVYAGGHVRTHRSGPHSNCEDRLIVVAGAVSWLDTYRTDVSRHPGLMCQDMADGWSRLDHVESPADHHRDRGRGAKPGRGHRPPTAACTTSASGGPTPEPTSRCWSRTCTSSSSTGPPVNSSASSPSTPPATTSPPAGHPDLPPKSTSPDPRIVGPGYADVLRHHTVAGAGFEPATSGL
jgi:hypothetical protein